jgi:hypothetical protein
MFRELITVFRVAKPKRPYKNFVLYCRAYGGDIGNRYPCLACYGQGRIDDPADSTGEYEYRRTFRCQECQGSGQGTKEACWQAYKAAIAKYHEDAQAYKRLVCIRRQALQRLTKDEIKAIRELGI